MSLDVTQVARGILDTVDVGSAPLSAKLRIVEALLELKRLETGSSDPVKREADVAKDPLFSWVDKCRRANRIGNCKVENGFVSVPKEHAYADYCRYCNEMRARPIHISQFGKRVRQLAEWGGTVRKRTTDGRQRLITLTFNTL